MDRRYLSRSLFFLTATLPRVFSLYFQYIDKEIFVEDV